jgi:ABC-type bacteriocin/lantibiotic exporter with double-glycine peptidase domain
MAAETEVSRPPSPQPPTGSFEPPSRDAAREPSGQRRLLAPEVVQTSAMDCGPAALKCLLEGFGIRVSYGRLREACQTSVDGTSFDTLESVAGMLGLEAEQIMLPPEHVIAPNSDALPAIAVVRLPSGMTHFVVLWRRVGPYLQIMDPARGRRWIRSSIFVRDLHVHTQAIDAEAFRQFAADPAFRDSLTWRLGRLTGSRRAAALRPLIDAAAADPSWRPMARLDGAIRAVDFLIAAGTVRRGAQAERLVRALLAAAPDPAFEDMLGAHSCALPAPESPDATPQLRFRGAVLVRITGRRSTDSQDTPQTLPPDLAAALGEIRVPLSRTLMALWTAHAKTIAASLVPVVLLAALGTIAEVVLVRPLLSSGAGTGTGVATGAVTGMAFAALCAVVAGLLFFELPLAFGTRTLGRALDQGLRLAFLRKLPRLGDRYFASRPVSDMAERAHLLHRVRLLPGLAAQLGRTLFELLLMTAAIVWLYPRGAPIAIALLVVACVVPLLGVPALAERDLRLRIHSGSLTRFYLDALLGLTAVRTHGAEQAVVRAHDERLQEWRRAGRDVVRASLSVETAVLLISASGAGLLVVGSLEALAPGPARAGTGLLLLFLSLGLPTQAARLIALVRQLPDHRNVTLRLIEPLGAPEEQSGEFEESAAEGVFPRMDSAAGISFEGVDVEVGGHLVLGDVSLEIEPGAHVAIVGASGAGKSTLVGLLLGLNRPVSGRLLLNGRPLLDGGGDLISLRSETVWIEPGVQLWNCSLRDNVTYGVSSQPSDDLLSRAFADAELADLISRLPQGIDTSLGEGGGLLSGGEGQRVRLARELIRVPRPRLVLLDEPFRGLDRDTRRRLLALTRARWASSTLLAVTHDIEQTQDFSRVLVIDGGRIVEDGHPGTLAAIPGSLYRGLLDAEARVRAHRWSASLWRHVVVHDGRVFSPFAPND